jgi:hypothetical protein
MLTSDNLDRLVRAIENSRGKACIRRHSRVVEKFDEGDHVTATIRVRDVEVWMAEFDTGSEEGRILSLAYHDLRNLDDGDDPELFLAGGARPLERRFDPEGDFSAVVADVLSDLGLILALPDDEIDVGPILLVVGYAPEEPE